jgi:hypothetical protein
MQDSLCVLACTQVLEHLEHLDCMLSLLANVVETGPLRRHIISLWQLCKCTVDSGVQQRNDVLRNGIHAS